jgi:putative ABC transport system permease protein
LTPTINAMLVVGVVKLPGMMTGQMLGGSAPFQAALYQMLILSGILFGDSLSATLSAGMLYRRYFTKAWQLDREALRAGTRSAG